MASMQREKFETSYSNLIHFSIFSYKEKKNIRIEKLENDLKHTENKLPKKEKSLLKTKRK